MTPLTAAKAFWVYPRVCGGTSAAAVDLVRKHGLSPRVRGNHGGELAGPGLARSIPACAGEPTTTPLRTTMTPVYPRVCGGTAGIASWVPIKKGLSPRVRGNPVGGRAPAVATGSIPACAGGPRSPGWGRRTGWVYPRVCGGTHNDNDDDDDADGLSPRVRGNPRLASASPSPAGSIPACAGEPKAASRLNPRWSVYPRVCGGTRTGRRPAAARRGLSPRVRGNLSQRTGNPASARSIPACAGEPFRSPDTGAGWRVYPRVCGGTRLPPEGEDEADGLSPRVRGNPGPAVPDAERGGSIPACAGEPSGR